VQSRNLFDTANASRLGVALGTSRRVAVSDGELWVAHGARVCIALRSAIDPAVTAGSCVAPEVA
jgi:hypothetical protein